MGETEDVQETDVRDRGCAGNQNSRQEKKPGGKRVAGKKEKRGREKGKEQEKGKEGKKKEKGKKKVAAETRKG